MRPYPEGHFVAVPSATSLYSEEHRGRTQRDESYTPEVSGFCTRRNDLRYPEGRLPRTWRDERLYSEGRKLRTRRNNGHTFEKRRSSFSLYLEGRLAVPGGTFRASLGS